MYAVISQQGEHDTLVGLYPTRESAEQHAAPIGAAIRGPFTSFYFHQRPEWRYVSRSVASGAAGG
jgi:hypothetical protein